MINRVTIVGNLGKDPEVRHLESGASVARFSVATNESYKDKQGEWQTQTEWHIVVVWRGLAEKAERELKKGGLVYVEGKLRTRTYQDSNGVEKSITEIDGQYLRSLERRERNDSSFPTANDQPAQFSSNEAPKQSLSEPAMPQQTSTPAAPKKEAMPEDDLPF
jgi:single-strand DNA-binding protein